MITGFCPDWDITITKATYKPFKISIKLKNDYILYKVSNGHAKKNRVNLNSSAFSIINQDSLIVRLEK
jgi:hypothetical protein